MSSDLSAPLPLDAFSTFPSPREGEHAIVSSKSQPAGSLPYFFLTCRRYGTRLYPWSEPLGREMMGQVVFGRLERRDD